MGCTPSRSRQIAVVFASVLLLTASGPQAQGKEETKNFEFLQLLRATRIYPHAAAIAAREGYGLSGIQTGTADAKPHAGDAVTALVELDSFNGTQAGAQWIIRLQLGEKKPPDSTKDKPNDWTEYTNTGEKFVFHSEQTGMILETLGPIKADAKPEQSPPVKRQEIFAAADFLGLDLSRAARVIGRIFQGPDKDHPLHLSVGAQSFPAAEINLQRTRANALNLSTDDLRSFAGTLPALAQFLDIVRHTPGLQEILYQVIDKPSLIDVFRSGANSSININFLGGGTLPQSRDIFWPDSQHDDFSAITFELIVFKKSILIVTLYLVTPRPPLLASAGIVGIVACKPKLDASDKYVVVRVLSSSQSNNSEL